MTSPYYGSKIFGSQQQGVFAIAKKQQVYSEIRCIALLFLQTQKLVRSDFGFFCSVNHFSESGVSVNHNVTCSPSLAENDSRLLKNSEGNGDGEWVFCRRKAADVALFLQVTRLRKTIKICKANLTSRLLPGTGRSQSNEP